MALQRPHSEEPPEIYEPTYEEGMAMLDRRARASLGISGEEFLRRFDAGEYQGIEEDEVGRAVVNLIFDIPFARPSYWSEDGRLLPVR